MSDSFGNKVRQLRKKRGFTLEQLANMIDSKKAYVWQLENKSPARPSGELLVKIARALGTTEAFLIDDEQLEVADRDTAEVLLRRMQDRNVSMSQFEKVLDFFEEMRKPDDG